MEIVNIWNLCFSETIVFLIMNYIVLGIVSEFDAQFLTTYRMTPSRNLVGLVIPILRFRKDKIILNKDTQSNISTQIESAEKLGNMHKKPSAKKVTMQEVIIKSLSLRYQQERLETLASEPINV